jgi:hypothetical protein
MGIRNIFKEFEQIVNAILQRGDQNNSDMIGRQNGRTCKFLI